MLRIPFHGWFWKALQFSFHGCFLDNAAKLLSFLKKRIYNKAAANRRLRGYRTMFKIRNYKLGFDIWGLTLFLAVMLPNFIWFAVPAVNDVLRKKSVTPLVDMTASVFQVIMAAALCVIVNQYCQKPMKKVLFRGIVILLLLYYTGWCLYYAGNTNPAVILDLSIAPCLAFILFSISRKNAAALLSAGIFMLCHVLYSIINFIL